ncbi:hypothetical protein C0992_012352 [Termitomyces sp. T32_za158]|nr:hypothetical protein C0992_012352 [Termitomyces sp. T32_za158]
MLTSGILTALSVTVICPFAYAANSQAYTWKNVKIGGGGGFVPGIVFNPTEKGQGIKLFGQATGMYTNSWDPNNGQILISKDYGATFSSSALPFKVGGNMPGRGM